MATHSSTLAWEIPSKEEPGMLQSMALQSVRNDLATEHTTHISNTNFRFQKKTIVNLAHVSVHRSRPQIKKPAQTVLLLTTNRHLPLWALAIYPSKDKAMCSCSWGPSTFPEGIQDGQQKRGSLCLGRETGRAGLQIVRYSRELLL